MLFHRNKFSFITSSVRDKKVKLKGKNYKAFHLQEQLGLKLQETNPGSSSMSAVLHTTKDVCVPGGPVLSGELENKESGICRIDELKSKNAKAEQRKQILKDNCLHFKWSLMKKQVRNGGVSAVITW